VIKQKLLRLFLNFCDFNRSQAVEYITQSTFLKIVKESGIAISEASLGILLSTTLQMKTNLIKMVTFQQFLSLISAVAEVKDPKKFKANPRKTLTNLIKNHFIPLLAQIESSMGPKKFGLNALYSQVDIA
jgi:hypothetical protein